MNLKLPQAIQGVEKPAGYTAEEILAGEKTEAIQTFINEDVCFDFDSAVLNNKAIEILKKKAACLEKYSGGSETIEGHCDERGTNEYNLALGERRANSAKEFLGNLGIAASRLKTISYGEEKHHDTAHDQEAWTKNRRARFVIKRNWNLSPNMRKLNAWNKRIRISRRPESIFMFTPGFPNAPHNGYCKRSDALKVLLNPVRSMKLPEKKEWVL